MSNRANILGIFILFFLCFTIANADELVIELKNGYKKVYEIDSIKKIYFEIEKEAFLIKKQEICNDYLILKKIPRGKIFINFEVKPYNFKNQVWFGGFCGPDGRGGIGLFIWNNKLKFTLGNSCKLRYPTKYIEWEFPIDIIKLNEWNKISIVYIPDEYVRVSINNFVKETTSNVPSYIVRNKVYIGTDPRHPGKNYNFCGEIRNINY